LPYPAADHFDEEHFPHLEDPSTVAASLARDVENKGKAQNYLPKSSESDDDKGSKNKKSEAKVHQQQQQRSAIFEARLAKLTSHVNQNQCSKKGTERRVVFPEASRSRPCRRGGARNGRHPTKESIPCA